MARLWGMSSEILDAAKVVATATAWKSSDDRELIVKVVEWDAAVKLAKHILSQGERVYGRIIDSEVSHEFGGAYGEIECRECDERLRIGVIGDNPKCRCGFQWEIVNEAVGTRQIEVDDDGT